MLDLLYFLFSTCLQLPNLDCNTESVTLVIAGLKDIPDENAVSKESIGIVPIFNTGVV